MSNLKQQGIKAFIWDFSGKLANQGVSFVISIFLARLLEPAEFGLIAMIMVVIGMASVFTDVGLGSALIQRKRVLPVHYSSVFYFNVFVGFLLTLITYLSADWIADFYRNDALLPLTEVMSLVFVINAFGSVQSTKLRKELNYAVLTKAGFIATLIGGGIGLTLAFQGFGVWSIVAQTLAYGVIFNLLLWFLNEWQPSRLFSVKALKQLWGFGFRMFLSAIIAAASERLDSLIIGKIFPAATLGYFERAKSLNNMLIQYSSGSLMAILYPILSTVQKNLPRLQNIVIKSMNIICFIVFLLIGILHLSSEEIIVLLFSEKWHQSVEFFRILTLSGFAYPVSSLLVNVLSSRGNSADFLRLEIYKKILIALNFVVLYVWGLKLYLYGMLFTSFSSVLLNMLFAAREIQLSFFKFLKPFLVQMVISASSVIFVMVVTQVLEFKGIQSLLTKVFLFTISYLFINSLFKTRSYIFFREEGLNLIESRGY